MKAFNIFLRAVTVVGLGALAAGSATAASNDLACKLEYQLKGWSAIYSQADGTGTVTCSDGTTKAVLIKMRSVGAAVGKSKVDHGVGKFTAIQSIDEVLGRYAQAGVDAGLVKSGAAQVLTKGNAALALAGAGEGVDIGLTIGEVTLEAVK